MRAWSSLILIVVSLSVLLPEVLLSSQVGPLILYPTDDTWLNYDCSDCNYGNYHYMLIENRGPPSYHCCKQQALVKFDLSSITPGATIVSATLYTYYWFCSSSSCSGREIICKKMLGSWNEDTATWDNSWSKYDHTFPDASYVIDSYGWLYWDVTGDVQDMIDGLVSSEGWMLMDCSAYSPLPVTYLRSKESGDHIPFLEITPASENWPMFCHDNYHRGHSTSRAPETDNLLWRYSTGGDVNSSPVVIDDRVYIASYNYLYCVDAEGNGDGTTDLIWSYSIGAKSTPSIVGGKLYIGSYDGNVYCLDAEGNGDGTTDLVWSYMTGNGIESSPAVVDGKVYIGSYDDNVYCLDAEGNGDETTDLIWSYTTGGYVVSSPAVAYDKVYIGSDDFNVYCLDAEGNGDETTDLIWSHPTGRCVRSSPTVTNCKVFVGSRDDNVYCLDAEGNGDGTTDIIWSYTTGGWVETSQALADGKIYITTGEYYMSVYCLDAEGNGDGTTDLIWSYTAGTTAGWVGGSPAVADGKLYIGSCDDNVYCLDAGGNGDGTTDLIWNYTTGDNIISSPGVARGKVYIGSQDHYIYCFGADPVPDTVQSSVEPWDSYSQAFVCPGVGASCDSVTVTVLDEYGEPCSYVSVEIDLSNCVDLCVDSLDGLSGITDKDGVVHLDPRVGGCEDCEIIVRAKDVNIRTYTRCTSADWDGGWGDGIVETADSMYFISQFMQPDPDPFTDYNGDDNVDLLDLAVLALCMGYSNAETCSLYYECEVIPDTLDFGIVLTETTKDTTFTIRNTGSGALCDTISEQCDNFDLVSNGGLYFIPSGDSLVVTVRFEPADTGTFFCSIETGDSHCCDVQCTGVGISRCTVLPVVIDFGEVYLGCQIDTNFTIVNSGLENLTGSVTENCLHDSIISGGGPYNLAPGETLEVTLRFEPTALDTHLCVIETGDILCCDVQCIGVGISPYAVYNAVIDFGDVNANCHRDTSFMIFNKGCENLTGNIIELCPYDSVITGGGPFDLAAGETLQVTVRFAPTSPGTYDCVIETGDTLCCDIQCTGVSPYLVTPGVLDFGRTEQGIRKELNFTIDNVMCAGSLEGFVQESPNSDHYRIISGEGPFSLNPGESRNITVRFQPTLIDSLTCIIDTGSELLRDVFCIGKCVPNTSAGKKNFFIEHSPNPFNPITEIRYNLPEDCAVKLDIYNALGRKIITLVDKHQSAGLRVVNWNGRDKKGTYVTSGIYFLRILAGNHIETRKMVLLK